MTDSLPSFSSRWMITRFWKSTGDVPVPRPSVLNFSTDLPRQLAGEVVRVEALGPEVRVDHACRRSPRSARRSCCGGDARRRRCLRTPCDPRGSSRSSRRSPAPSACACDRPPRCRDGSNSFPSMVWIDGFRPGHDLAFDGRGHENRDRPRRSATSARRAAPSSTRCSCRAPTRSAAASRSRSPGCRARATAASSRRRRARRTLP